jgi:general secretion pathway protein E
MSLPSEAWEARGCEACGFSGFAGRVGAFELLEIRAELAAAIERGDAPTQLSKIAFGLGHKPMVVDALRHVAAGVTSEGELLRHLTYEDAE